MAEFDLPQNDPVFQPVLHVPVAPFVPGAPLAPTQPELPMTFCIKTRMGNRDGYYLLRWSQGGLDPNGKIIHVLKAANHLDRFYNIATVTRHPNWYKVITRKNSGTLTREIQWRFSPQNLRYDGTNIPVLKISPASTSLPSIKASSFIPITAPEIQVPVVPVPLPVVPVPVVQKKFTIATIPQHTVMALLRDAAMQEEVCPITSEEIDITNGAVTSCFHLFEKNAIMQWLLMPNSRDKCPVCNAQCNSFTLDGPPPLDMSTN